MLKKVCDEQTINTSNIKQDPKGTDYGEVGEA